MMKKTFFLLFNFLIITNLCFSQSANIPLDKDYLHWIDRYEIRQKSFSPYFFTSVKAFPRKKVALFADSLFKLEGIIRSQADRFNLFYLANDNWEFCRSDSNDSRRPLIRHFYKKTSDLYYVQTEDFDLHLNPVWHFSIGKDNNVVERVFINSRGLVGRGIVGNKVGFYFYVVENQARFPRFV
ncbi:MAG: hypothetical protein NZ521_11535, partial [Flammeovirgaceae bacterium]|nr:hypothetical protein [Flammeovirgaceae bacterium]MDW8288823.1 hypothetical protein [Flammeovirgaceae bacterium]